MNSTNPEGYMVNAEVNGTQSSSEVDIGHAEPDERRSKGLDVKNISASWGMDDNSMMMGEFFSFVWVWYATIPPELYFFRTFFKAINFELLIFVRFIHVSTRRQHSTESGFKLQRRREHDRWTDASRPEHGQRGFQLIISNNSRQYAPVDTGQQRCRSWHEAWYALFECFC